MKIEQYRDELTVVVSKSIGLFEAINPVGIRNGTKKLAGWITNTDILLNIVAYIQSTEFNRLAEVDEGFLKSRETIERFIDQADSQEGRAQRAIEFVSDIVAHHSGIKNHIGLIPGTVLLHLGASLLVSLPIVQREITAYLEERLG